jgi:Arc/MetJ family transcription regulator
MSVTRIDLDDDALAEVMRIPGTTTAEDTVNAALRKVADRGGRVVATERLAAAYKRGEFDAGFHAYEARKAGAICVEIPFSATGPGHREQLLEEFNRMCEPVRVPRDAWR